MKKLYKLMLCIVIPILISFTTKAQLAGTYSVPSTYSTIGAAIADLNAQGVNGNVTILINAGYNETAPSNGYSLTATGTATSTITFQKNGAGLNPLITAYSGGSAIPSSALQDGVWRLIGSDYITIDGIDIIDPNITNPSTMEFGYGLFKASATDGCQNNTIKNCNISLSIVNNDFGAAPASDGSRGIDIVNAMSGAHTTPITITSTLGSNSNNKFYNNTIRNCNIGISLIGYSDFSPFNNADWNNDVGGLLPSTGNRITNYGGATSAIYPADGMRTAAQYSLNISNNLINNNTGSGVNHVNTLRGFYLNTAQSANVTITNNTITLNPGGPTSLYSPIYNLSGSSAANNTITISNNLIANCSYTVGSSPTFYGIYNGSSPSALSINSNTFLNNSNNAISGSFYNIYNGGAANNQININSNLLNLGTFNASSNSALLIGVYNLSGTGTTSLSISSNTLQNAVYNGSGTSSAYLIYNSTTQSVTTISSNIFNNLSLNISGTVYFMYNCNATPSTSIINNKITGSFSKPTLGGTVYGYYNGCSASGSLTISGNDYSNINLAGASYYGIYNLTSTTQTISVTSNTISNITNSNGGYVIYGMLCYYPYVISNNLISNFSGGNSIIGLYIPSGTNSLSIYSNTISALSTTGAVTMYGMYAAASTTMNIYKNKIYNLSVNYPFGSGTIYGMYIGAGTLNTISNNYIGDIRTPYANATLPLIGIYVAGGTTSNLFYNTVHLNATSSGFSFGSTALYASTGINLNLRNNILINLSVPNGGQYTSAYRRTSNSLTTYSATSNNNIFYAGTPSANNLIFYDGTTPQQTLANYQTLVSPRDNLSQTENTPFLSVVGSSPGFLHINPNAPSLTESGAVNIAGITDDYDNDIRQGNPGYTGTGTAPDIGADEFNATVVNCNATVGGTASPTSVFACNGQMVTLNGSGYSAGNGITYQWQVSNTPSGPYSNVVGGNGMNYPLAYTTPTLATGVYYYVLLTTCTISNLSSVSQEATVTILGYPNVAVTPSVSSICVPGGSSVTLIASGANTYTWSPAIGLSSTVGVSVNAFPPSSTMYTIIGSNLGGCTSSATAVVNIAEFPNLVSISTSPTLVCGGGNASLTALGVTTSSYVVSTIPFAPIPTPPGATTLCNNGVAIVPLSSGNLDDGGWINLNIPFNFNFYGNSYTNFAVGSNGIVGLGQGIPYTFTGYGVALPYAFAAHPLIAPIYGDLDFRFFGMIETFTTGLAPFRKQVINFKGGQFYSNTGSLTAQAILYETTNIIEAHVLLSTGNGAAVQGIQDATGTNAIVVTGRNAVTWPVTTPDAHRWAPAGGPLTYSWTPSTFLSSNTIQSPIANSVTTTITYTAIATTTAGCSTSSAVTVLADANPTIVITGTNAVCSTSIANLTASGAVNYTWSTGATTSTMANTPTANITYTVVGTSSTGCIGTGAHSVTVNITPTVSITGPSTVCANNFINLGANGADTYSWSNGSTLLLIAPAPSVNTTYSLLGTNSIGSCTNIAFKSVTIVALPTVTITPSPGGTICVGQSAQLIASASGADTYSWSTGSPSAITIVSPTITSTYTVFIGSNFTGCGNEGVFILDVVKSCSGLEENSLGLEGLLIYPNPNNGEFTIELKNNSEKKFELTDVTGRTVLKDSSSSDKINVSITDLVKGIYFIRIESNKQTNILKIIKD